MSDKVYDWNVQYWDEDGDQWGSAWILGVAPKPKRWYRDGLLLALYGLAVAMFLVGVVVGMAVQLSINHAWPT